MIETIINQLVIAAWQFERFGEAKYEKQFELLLDRLQRVTGSSREGTIDLLLNELGAQRVKEAV